MDEKRDRIRVQLSPGYVEVDDATCALYGQLLDQINEVASPSPVPSLRDQIIEAMAYQFAWKRNDLRIVNAVDLIVFLVEAEYARRSAFRELDGPTHKEQP